MKISLNFIPRSLIDNKSALSLGNDQYGTA